MSAPDPDTLHIVSRFGDPYSGAELQVMELARRLKGLRQVQVWSDIPPHPVFARQGVRQIRPFDRQVPVGGTLLFGTIYLDTALWLRQARPKRLVICYNVVNHDALFAKIAEARTATGLEPELTFVSAPLQAAVNLPGMIEPSWIDLSSFLAVPLARPAGRPLRVGRLSRDIAGKHHPQDPSLYRMLAQRGLQVRVQGGTCLAGELAGVKGVELLPAGALPAADLLASLDLFFYRLGDFSEAYGRVVIEAMASGLPVVCGVMGGYVQAVESGVSGQLVRSQEEAFDALMHLASQPELRAEMGSRARVRAINLHSERATDHLLQFYLRPDQV